MHSSSRLRGPLRDIIKSVGSHTPSLEFYRRYASSAQAQTIWAKEEELDSKIAPHLTRPSEGTKIRNDAHVSKEPELQNSNTTVSDEPSIMYTPRKDYLEPPQPSMVRGLYRATSQSYKGAYRMAQNAKSNILQYQKQYQLDRHGYDDTVIWPTVLDMLTHATPTGAHHHVKRWERIRLTDGCRAMFKTDKRSAVAEIMQRTGSHVVELIPSVSTGDAFSTLTLYGRPDQNLEAIKLLRSLVTIEGVSSSVGSVEPQMLLSEEVRSGEYEAQTSCSEPELGATGDALGGHAGASSIRPALTIRDYWHGKEIANLTAEERKALRPEEWNTLSFTQYVDLLTARSPFLYRRKGQRTGVQTSDTTHLDLVTQELCELFISSPQLASCISSNAVDSAFTFLLRYRDLPTIHRIMSAIERTPECSLTATNFDVLIAHAAKVGDVHNYRYVLQTMLRLQLRPTEQTWLRFHQLVCKRFSPDAAAKVAQRMRQKGLLSSPRVIRELADNMIQPALADYMTAPTATITHLIRAIDKTVSLYLPTHPVQSAKSWLTVSAANKMINFCLSEGRQEDALKVLEEIPRRDEKVSTETLNTFLTSKARASDLEGALAILQHFHRLPAIPQDALKLNALSFHLLFGVALRNKFHNTMRVIWRYACVSGQMPRLLPHMTQTSLYSSLPASKDRAKFDGPRNHDQDNDQKLLLDPSQMDISFGFWGKFVIGVAPENQQPGPAELMTYDETVQQMSARQHPRKLTSLESSIMDFVRSSPPASLAQQARPQALQTAFSSDLTEHLSLTPVVPFMDLLRRAWELDTAMKRTKLDTLPSSMKADDGDPQRKQKLHLCLTDILETMFSWGIDVPMEVSTKRAEIYL